MNNTNVSDIIRDLYAVVMSRKGKHEEGSYTCYLFESGIDKILKKVGEECAETIVAAKNGDNRELTVEICDLLYHLIVMMADRGVSPDDIIAELQTRSKKMHNLKQMKTVDKNS